MTVGRVYSNVAEFADRNILHIMLEQKEKQLEKLERERDEARAWSSRWKNAARDWRRFAQDFWRRKRVLAQERDHWKSESLEQAKLLAMGADREEKLRAEIAGWENKWQCAVEMAALAEMKLHDVKVAKQ